MALTATAGPCTRCARLLSLHARDRALCHRVRAVRVLLCNLQGLLEGSCSDVGLPRSGTALPLPWPCPARGARAWRALLWGCPRPAGRSRLLPAAGRRRAGRCHGCAKGYGGPDVAASRAEGQGGDEPRGSAYRLAIPRRLVGSFRAGGRLTDVAPSCGPVAALGEGKGLHRVASLGACDGRCSQCRGGAGAVVLLRVPCGPVRPLVASPRAGALGAALATAGRAALGCTALRALVRFCSNPDTPPVSAVEVPHGGPARGDK